MSGSPTHTHTHAKKRFLKTRAKIGEGKIVEFKNLRIRFCKIFIKFTLLNCQIWRFWKCKISKIWTRFWRFQAQKFLNVKTSNLMVFIKRKMFSIVLGRRFCFRCFHKPFRKFKIRCFQPYVRKSATIVGSTCPVTHTHAKSCSLQMSGSPTHTHAKKRFLKTRAKIGEGKIVEFKNLRIRFCKIFKNFTSNI